MVLILAVFRNNLLQTYGYIWVVPLGFLGQSDEGFQGTVQVLGNLFEMWLPSVTIYYY